MPLLMKVASVSMILIYLAIVTYIGIIKPRTKKKNTEETVEDFLTGSKSMSAFVVGMIMIVTMYSGSTFTRKLGYVVKFGMGGLYSVSYVVIGGVVFYYLAEKVWPLGKKYKLATMSDTVELRYQSKKLKMLSGGTAALLNIPWLTLEVTTIGYILNSVTGGLISISLGAFIAIVFITCYLLFAGVHAVSAVDSFSAICMLVGSTIVFLYLFFGTFDGSLSNIWNAIASSNESISHLDVTDKISIIGKDYFTLLDGSSASSWQFLVSWTVLGVLGFLIWPSNYMQIYLGKNVEEVRKTGIITGIAGLYNIAYVLLGFMVVAVASSKVGFSITDPQASLLDLIIYLGNPFIYGILATFMLAITVGTMDSTLLAISGIFANDIVNTYRGIKNKEEIIGEKKGTLAAEERVRKTAKADMKTMRILIVIVAIAAYILGLMRLPMMLVVAGYVYQCIVQIVPLVVGGLYWKKATKKGALFGYLIGMIFTIISIIVEKNTGLLLFNGVFPGVIGVAVNFCVFIVVSKLTYTEGTIPLHIEEDLFYQYKNKPTNDKEKVYSH